MKGFFNVRASRPLCALGVGCALLLNSGAVAAPVFQATGFKITEPTEASVRIWSRVTRDPDHVSGEGPLPTVRAKDRATGVLEDVRDNVAYPSASPVVEFPEGVDLGGIRGAAPGAAGQSRVRFRPTGVADWAETEWRDVGPESDFSTVCTLAGLRSTTRYEVVVQVRPGPGAEVSCERRGGFTTAPAPGEDASGTFTVMSCQQYEDRDFSEGFALYPAMAKLRPGFFVNTGDAVYYDHGPVHALNLDLARYHWARMFSLHTLRDFHQEVASFFMKDDHDTHTDDSHPGARTGDFTFEDGLRVFREQTAPSEPSYRRARWGRHLEVWLLEGRDYRSRREQDRTQVPTILGAAQIDWLERTLGASEATFKVVITPTPVLGPDRAAKDDNYSNRGYKVEGDGVRALLARHKNLTLITGDRHWQYVSRLEPEGLEEWSVGAASDRHAGGWNETKPRPEHRFLRTKHGGFLSGVLTSGGGGPELKLSLHDSGGAVVFSDVKRGAGGGKPGK